MNSHRNFEQLKEFRLFATTDVDVAREEVARRFCSHFLSPGSDHQQFNVVHNHARGINVSLNYLCYGSEVIINPGELNEFYLIKFPIFGNATVKNGHTTVLENENTGSVLNPTRETRMVWHSGCEKLLLQVSRKALQDFAERLTDRPLPEAVVFNPQLNLANPAIQNWVHKFKSSVQVAQHRQAYGDNFHEHQAFLEEELVLHFLQTQESTISHMIEGPIALGSPVQIRRARSYIMDNLNRPLTVSKIAEEAGCSIRSLQLGFQRYYGCTPGQFIKRERLNQAHYLLQSQSINDKSANNRVSDIAFASGFSHLGRFSASYHRTFGQYPSATLHYGIGH